MRVAVCIATIVFVSAAGHIDAGAVSCSASDITGISYTSTSLAPYNPFTPFAPKVVSVTVSAMRACGLELAFLSTVNPPRMTGFGTLNYDIQLSSSTTSLVYTGGTPATTAHIDIGPGNSGFTNVQISLPPGQVVGDGVYSDASVVGQIFDKTGAIFTLLKTANLPLSGSVVRACQFMAPTSPTLNFTSAISNGLPRPGYIQSVTFQNVSCTAPSVVRLSGNAMLLDQPGNPTPVFDALINYRASASFSGASVVLDTSVGADATSGSRNQAAGAVTEGVVRVDVGLLAGKPLLPGTYSSILTVSIDPNP
jgi:hypothetical protein